MLSLTNTFARKERSFVGALRKDILFLSQPLHEIVEERRIHCARHGEACMRTQDNNARGRLKHAGAAHTGRMWLWPSIVASNMHRQTDRQTDRCIVHALTFVISCQIALHVSRELKHHAPRVQGNSSFVLLVTGVCVHMSICACGRWWWL